MKFDKKRAAERFLSKTSSGPDLAKPPTDDVGIKKSDSANRLSEATARALGDALYDEIHGEPIGQVLVICGRNKKLANKLQSITWKIPVQVQGFVTKMEECMGACDCIITKAGPGTIAEAMIRRLPIILNDYIAGQVIFVVDASGSITLNKIQNAKGAAIKLLVESYTH